MSNERCRGWICPQRQTCSAEIVGSCETDDCNIKRTCHEVHVTAANDSASSFSRRSLKKEDEVPRNDSEVHFFLNRIELFLYIVKWNRVSTYYGNINLGLTKLLSIN